MPTSLNSLGKRPSDIVVEEKIIRLGFDDGTSIRIPLHLFPRLERASHSQRVNWRWIGSRHGINWPEVDEDISVETLMKLSQRHHYVPVLVADLFKITTQLGELYKGRPFTPDGHLVGSIGEVVASHVYDLTLENCSTPQIDAKTQDGRTVQIKLTGSSGKSYGMRWSNLRELRPADILICLKMEANTFVEIFNGEFPIDLLRNRPDSTNGQLSLSVAKLRAMNPSLLPQINPLSDFNLNFHREFSSAA